MTVRHRSLMARDLAQRYRAVVAPKPISVTIMAPAPARGRYGTGMTWSAADYLLLAKFYPGASDGRSSD